MCGALGVSRSGFHAWLIRPPSQRARDDEVIGAKVRASYRTYGAVSGTICWPTGYPAVYTGSNG
jgi:hypothetical protein